MHKIFNKKKHCAQKVSHINFLVFNEIDYKVLYPKDNVSFNRKEYSKNYLRSEILVGLTSSLMFWLSLEGNDIDRVTTQPRKFRNSMNISGNIRQKFDSLSFMMRGMPRRKPKSMQTLLYHIQEGSHL